MCMILRVRICYDSSIEPRPRFRSLETQIASARAEQQRQQHPLYQTRRRPVTVVGFGTSARSVARPSSRRPSCRDTPTLILA